MTDGGFIPTAMILSPLLLVGSGAGARHRADTTAYDEYDEPEYRVRDLQ